MKRYIKHIMMTACLSLSSLWVLAQTAVTGRVTSTTDNQPLVGVTVLVQGTNNGTTTNVDGTYQLQRVDKNAVLVFSMIGYSTERRAVANRTVIDIQLKEASTTLDDVVVVGYGVVRKSDLTSSIATVKGDEITEMTTGNAMDALQGKVLGVQVASGGGPGTTPRVIIRGVTTSNGSNPLYVVDGMPVGDNINFLNNDDIASMEVLKDASAAAIYGTRGSNGVILITTKKGRLNQPTQFTFTSSVGLQTIADPGMAHASEFEQVFKARYQNDGAVAPWNATNATDTDWWNETIKNFAIVQNYTLGFSGGSDKFVYSGSLGYFRNGSHYDYGYWDKITARINAEWRFNRVVRLGVDFAPRTESWDDTPNVFGNVMSMDPTTPIMRPEEEWTDNPYDNYARSHNNEAWNPVAQVARMNAHSREYGVLANPYLELHPVDGLTLRTQFGINARFRRSDDFTPAFNMHAQEQQINNSVSREITEWVDWNWTNTATYMKTFNKKHNLNAMIGFTAERFQTANVKGGRENVPSDTVESLWELDAGTMNQTNSGTSSVETLVSYLARVMYNYDNRYYVTASVRADGSSKFPENNRYGIFPSASVAWRIIGEKFMQDQRVFTNLKLRAGWGRVGNQAIPAGRDITRLGTGSYVIGGVRYPFTTLGDMGNPDLFWETVEDFNVGLDMGFLRDRLNVTFELFQKKSHDMLYSRENPLFSGYTDYNCNLWGNIGSMKAAGWELSVNWADRSKDFTYDIGLQLSSVKNTAVRFTGLNPIDAASWHSSYITRNEDGGEISRFYGYVCDGIFQNWAEVYAHSDEHGNLLQPSAQPGDLRFRDLNNDGKLDTEDRTYIGNAFPDLMIGLNTHFTYRNFDLTANFYGTLGNDIFNTTLERYSGTGGSNVYAGTWNKTWREDNTGASFPRLTAADNNGNYTTISSFYVEDGSYFRCKLLQLGYSVPLKNSKYSLRFSVSVQNAFTITGYSGMDPERAMLAGDVLSTGIDWSEYPNPRTYLFGVDFKF